MAGETEGQKSDPSDLPKVTKLVKWQGWNLMRFGLSLGCLEVPRHSMVLL